MPTPLRLLRTSFSIIVFGELFRCSLGWSWCGGRAFDVGTESLQIRDGSDYLAIFIGVDHAGLQILNDFCRLSFQVFLRRAIFKTVRIGNTEPTQRLDSRRQ